MSHPTAPSIFVRTPLVRPDRNEGGRLKISPSQHISYVLYYEIENDRYRMARPLCGGDPGIASPSPTPENPLPVCEHCSEIAERREIMVTRMWPEPEVESEDPVERNVQ